MLFIYRVIVIFLSFVAAAHSTTIAVPIENSYPTMDEAQTDNATDYKSKASSANSVQSKSASSFASSDKTSQPVLLIRVSFNDQDFTYPRSEFQNLMFSSDPDASSVTRYFLENSYQQFHIQPATENQGIANDGIIDIFLPYAHPNFGEDYGARSQALVRDALATADLYINFRAFDRNFDAEISSSELSIIFMIAGYENAYGGSSASEPNVWAHKSNLTDASYDEVSLTAFAMFGEQHQDHLATIGIISHEMGHLMFALPDLYDRQGNSNGIGSWGLMGLGSWNARGGYSGSSPAHMMAWSKEKAGFLQPEDITGNNLYIDLVSATLAPEAMRVWLDPFRHGEHFLLEYRKHSNLDRALPGAGLLITHIDDWVGYGTSGPQNDVVEHKLVDIEEADGRDDLDQRENRGDRFDVYNDYYGQDYFGSSSFPTSLDYQGNASGVEISNIRVGDRVQANIALPYEELGDNLGFDTHVGGSWGSKGRQVNSLIALPISPQLSWAHGVDIYSPGLAELNITLFASFSDGVLSSEVYSLKGETVVKGWNRVSFAERINLRQYNNIYMKISARSDSSRPFNIDNKSPASGQSYFESMGVYQKASFDFNQRLLVANQSQAFEYKVPDAVASSPEEKEESSGGGSLSISLIILSLLSLRGIGVSGIKRRRLGLSSL
ncbi:MAG: immune inhibitor A [Oleispira sp.]|jgi:immune inhibitor A